MNVLRVMELQFKMEKKSQSEVVVAVLLITISVLLAVILINVLIPFVNKQLSKGNCFDVLDQISITSNPKYNCYDSSNQVMRVQVHIEENKSIQGFTIEVGGAATTAYKITDGNTNANIRMYQGSFGGPLNSPKRNEEKTYEIKQTTKPDSVRVYPILSGDMVCDSSTTLTTIEPCS